MFILILVDIEFICPSFTSSKHTKFTGPAARGYRKENNTDKKDTLKLAHYTVNVKKGDNTDKKDTLKLAYYTTVNEKKRR